ncbi:hypothetical protein GN958_ATG17825 [Phytophthora infestans]|uniref:Uncharacterized protein n=1 Tax=Phytophthora infestans TaxID=4787 RepID=A0A8S9U1P1_PHYIN|nr:hypothetical protein GN958_ATG17825 [Phytophthora infestans]
MPVSQMPALRQRDPGITATVVPSIILYSKTRVIELSATIVSAVTSAVPCPWPLRRCNLLQCKIPRECCADVRQVATINTATVHHKFSYKYSGETIIAANRIKNGRRNAALAPSSFALKSSKQRRMY